jgi:autotransporter-associated beta strand protein
MNRIKNWGCIKVAKGVFLFTSVAKRAVVAFALLALASTGQAQLTSSTTTNGIYTITSFTAGSGPWTVPDGVTNVSVLVVGGGGGGGNNGGGGGGAGGVIYSNAFTVASGSSYTVTVGAGGAAGVNGSNSMFSVLTSIGGGGGGSRGAVQIGQNGGSGGGGASPNGGAGTGGTGTAGQGNNGGSGLNASPSYGGGGGGGAGAAGSNGTGSTGGNGGNGIAISITGTSVYYGGGGGGGLALAPGGTVGTGGLGGGGRGGAGGTGSFAASNGVVNTGGGGGGNLGTGGSGIVIVRYAQPSLYWDGSGSGWDAPTSWSTASGATTPDPATAPGANDVAVFNTTNLNTAQTINLNAAQAAMGLAFNSTGTVTLQGGGSDQTLSLGINGIFATSGTGAVTIGSVSSGQKVDISLQSSQPWINNGTGVLTVNNGVSIGSGGNQTLTLNGTSTGTNTIAGVIANGVSTLSLVKDDVGSWILSGANTYTGATTINTGTLFINAPGSLGSSPLTVMSGATLGGNGTINGPVTVGSGANLAPGAFTNTIGMLSLTNTLTLTNANLYVDLVTTTTPGTTYDQIATSGSLVLNGTNYVYPNASTTGTYRILACTGTPSGTGNIVFQNGLTNMNGSTIAFVDGGVDLTLANLGNATAVWKGSPSSSTWDNYATNWVRNGSASSVFVPGDPVIFDNTAANFTVSSVGTVVPASVIVSNTTAYTISATIGGSGSLTKNLSGTLILSSANTYTGTTTINAGILALTSQSSLSGGKIVINNGANLMVAAGGGQTTGITIGNNIELGGTGGSRTLQIYNSNQKAVFAGAISVTASANTTLNLIAGNKPSAVGGNGTTLGEKGNLTITGAISEGTGGVTLGLTISMDSQTASGVYVNLSGKNTFTGPISVTYAKAAGGYLTIGGESSGIGQNYRTTAVMGSGYLGGGNYANTISLGVNTILDYLSSADQILGGQISGAGQLLKEGSGTLILSGTNNYTGTTTIGNGALVIGGAGVLGSGNYAGTIANSTTFTVNSTATQTLSGVISGTGVLIKDNTGPLTLSENNTYSGATTIRGGTLWGRVGGSCSNSTVTVTNTPSVLAALGVSVINTNTQWTCSNLTIRVNGVGAQLKYNFSVSPGTLLPPLNIINTLSFSNGVPEVVVTATTLPYGTYPLLITGGTAPTTVPTVTLEAGNPSAIGSLSWGGVNNKTLYLNVQAKGTVLLFL